MAEAFPRHLRAFLTAGLAVATVAVAAFTEESIKSRRLVPAANVSTQPTGCQLYLERPGFGKAFSWLDGQVSVTVHDTPINSFPPAIQVNVSCDPPQPYISNLR